MRWVRLATGGLAAAALAALLLSVGSLALGAGGATVSLAPACRSGHAAAGGCRRAARPAALRVVAKRARRALAAARSLGVVPAGCAAPCQPPVKTDIAVAVAIAGNGLTHAPKEEGPGPVSSALGEAVGAPVEAPAPVTEAPPAAEAPVEEAPPAEEPPPVEGEEPEEPPAEEPPPVEEPEVPPESSEPSSDPGCPLAAESSEAPIAMSLLGCELVASDTGENPDPLPFWGSIQCVEDSRYSYLESGGDTHPAANGEAANGAYRRLTVQDGDDFWGERCELGLNDHRVGPTAFYHQGEHLITYFSERLPSNYPLANSAWQTVMQMKQAQPADAGGEGPILEMQAREGKWVVVNAWETLWTFPAQVGKWTRFAWDVYYNQDPAKGWLQVSVDLNGDGDFNDSKERSPILHAATLKTEIEGPNGGEDGLLPGDPIPSHLRMGIYHDPDISCAAPVECSVEIDNVQVLAPQP